MIHHSVIQIVRSVSTGLENGDTLSTTAQSDSISLAKQAHENISPCVRRCDRHNRLNGGQTMLPRRVMCKLVSTGLYCACPPADIVPLRTVPTIVTAHTFCGSRDTWVVPTNTRIVLRSLKLFGDGRTLQVLLVSKKKIWGNHVFFRDNEASIWIKTPYIALYFTAFWNNCCLLISKKMRGYPQFSFWISIALAKISFSRIVINRAKILRYWKAPSLT